MASLIVSGKGGGGDYELHPPGPVAARCVRIIDLGTQAGEWKGKAKNVRKVQFGFESEALMTEGEMAGKPFLITQRFTLSIGEKAGLRKFLESWRGRPFTPQEIEGFDLKNVLGKAVMLNMVHSDPKPGSKQYANIASAMPLPASMKAPAAQQDPIFLSLDDFDVDAFDRLSDGLKETIKKSPEYAAATGSKPAPSSGKPPVDDDDIPF